MIQFGKFHHIVPVYLGKSILISSHILPELSEMCDSLTILDHGKLVFSGTVEALADKMNGNAPLDIRLQGDCGEETVEKTVACLKEIPFVKEILQEEPRMLRVRLEGGETETMQVLHELIARQIPVCDFHRAPMNLEKVFMEVTGDA